MCEKNKIMKENLIYKFKSLDLNLVLDINQNGVYVFDDLAYEILNYWPDKKNMILNLKNYDREELLEAFNEINKLKSSGMLFNNLNIKYKFKPVLKALCLNIAHACNLKCKYCFAHDYSQKNQELMDFEVAKRAIDFIIKNSPGRKNLEIDFFGGEPLLNFDLIKKTISYAREQEKIFDKNFRFTITTNGLLLDQEKINYLNQNMYNIVLSLDGRKEIHDAMRPDKNNLGSYERALVNFKKLIKIRKENYYIRGTFSNLNLDFTKDIMHLVNLGFDKISIEPVIANPEESYALCEKDLEKIFAQYEKLAKIMLDKKNKFVFFHFEIDLKNKLCLSKKISGCGAGSEYLAVTPNGDLYPCHQFIENKNFKLGDIFSQEINLNIKKEFINCNVFNKKKCKSCWAKLYCSGGCHATAFKFNKNIYEPHEFSCQLEKKRLEYAIALKAKKIYESFS